MKNTPGIGNLIIKRLVKRFKTPEAVFNATREQLLEVDGMSSRLVSNLRHGDWNHSEVFRQELETAEQNGFRIVTFNDSDYPPLLKRIPDPPPFFYLYGRFDPNQRALAIVGSRKATPYGISATKSLCRDLAAAGVLVVSGMALGIDTAAHRGALEGGGPTVAVLGCGLDRIYPPKNTRLYHDIAENGAVLSEFPLATKPESHHFPMRNRIISGISSGVVVVEATKRSGSLITARLALEQNREVFAVPGSIQSFASKGTHGLIKQGAKLVESVEDVLEELPPTESSFCSQTFLAKTENTPDLTDEETRVVAAMSAYPITADKLIQELKISSSRMMACLFSLEIKGIVSQFPGNRFALISTIEPAFQQKFANFHDMDKKEKNLTE